MKGTLHKTEQGWQVSYASYDITSNNWSAGKLPLHPDFIEAMETCFTSKFTQEVEFETVKEYIDSHTNQVQKYAKLIKQEDMCEYSGLRAVTSYIETKENTYTEEQLKLAYIQGYNRGKDGNPNHMESYIEFLKQQKG